MDSSLTGLSDMYNKIIHNMSLSEDLLNYYSTIIKNRNKIIKLFPIILRQSEDFLLKEK